MCYVFPFPLPVLQLILPHCITSSRRLSQLLIISTLFVCVGKENNCSYRYVHYSAKCPVKSQWSKCKYIMLKQQQLAYKIALLRHLEWLCFANHRMADDITMILKPEANDSPKTIVNKTKQNHPLNLGR
ncbi:hypothetical protein Tcan_01569, partial [Toxocara canis]